MMTRRTNTPTWVLGLAASLLLGGCLTGGSSDSPQLQGPGNPNPPPPSNTAPTINGSPSGTVAVGDTFSFTPTAFDADGDPLSFLVENLPAWANFDSTTGALTGAPDMGDEGLYTDIRISV